jgi:hypothetical protein
VSAATRLMTAAGVLAGCLLLANPAHAAKVGWVDAGGTRSGQVATDPAHEEILSSIGSINRSNGQVRGSSAAPVCSWLPGLEAAARIPDLRPESVGLVGTERVEPDGTRSRLYGRVCGGQVGGWQWFRVPDAVDLVGAAGVEVRRRLPVPRGVFSPDPALGPALVGVPLWFAVPGQWAPVTATAAAAGASVTVTATPTTLRFDPGDGAPPVSCVGPGPVFTAGTVEPDRPPACSYTYRDASSVAPDGRSWPASLAIGWRVTWAANNDRTGVLDPLTTQTSVPVVVDQIQTVVTAR